MATIKLIIKIMELLSKYFNTHFEDIKIKRGLNSRKKAVEIKNGDKI